MKYLDSINLSALNQFTYCPRRCGLIYQEGEFTDNIHTARGNAEHERVDRVAHETAKSGARVEYALPVWSDKFGLIGKCDVVEFWPDGTIFPIEYKHGRKRERLNDDLQLTAQAMCLENMFERSVLRGAIFHATSHRRREVVFTEALKEQVVETADAIRVMLASGRLPPPVNDARCNECSMKEICQPQALAERSRQRMYATALFSVQDDINP